MRKVAVIGIGQTRVEEHWDQSLRDLAGEAALAALDDAGINTVEGIYVGNMMSGSANKQMQLGAYLADWIGLRFSEAVHLESACGSGAAAFRTALMAISSGDISTALVIGVEKMADSPNAEITSSLATAADADWEVTQGISFVGLNALIMKRYMFEYNWKHSDFAGFSINAHANAMNNPNARFHTPITLEQFEKAAAVSEPIHLLDASPTGDGSAAIVLTAVDTFKPNPQVKLIQVVGCGSATDNISIQNRKDPLWLRAAELSAKQAYAQSGIGPKDIDVFEYHDAFTIMCALSLEASGFTERGQAPRLALDEQIKLKGRIPTATLGGLKARGHPVGATGVYQLVELVQQLRGTAGKSQVEGARFGMAQNIGGSGSNVITHILQAG